MALFRIYTYRLFCCLMLAAAMLVSCNSEDSVMDVPEGGNCVAFILDSRAVTPGDGSLADGGGMQDVLLFLVDASGKIVGKADEAVTGTDNTRKEILFTDLEIGVYTVYAYANRTSASQYIDNFAAIETLAVGDDFNYFDMTFKSLGTTGTDTPQMVSPMFLTATKELIVRYGSNSAKIEMLRPFVDFSVKVYNNTPYDVVVDQSTISFSKFNANTSYVLSHDGEIPATVTYRSLPAMSEVVTISAVNALSEETASGVVYNTKLYENRSNEAYTFDITLSVVDEVEVPGETVMELANSNTTDEFLIGFTLNDETYYLYDDDGNLEFTTSPSTGNEYLWTFTRTGTAYYVQNVSTGRYITITNNAVDLSTSTDNANITFSSFGGTSSKMSRTIRSGYRNRTYYIRYSSNWLGRVNLSSSTTDSNNTLQFYKMQVTSTTTQTQTIATKNISGEKIMAVDGTTGVVSDMTEMLRNQSVTLSLYIYYEETGEFNYEVQPWEEKSQEVEFN